MRHVIFSGEIMRHLGLLPQGSCWCYICNTKIKGIIISSTTISVFFNHEALDFVLKECWVAWFFHCRNNTSRITEATSPSVPLLLQKNMKHLTRSPEKNKVPPYFSRKNQCFLFWKNNEALDVFWRHNGCSIFSL